MPEDHFRRPNFPHLRNKVQGLRHSDIAIWTESASKRARRWRMVSKPLIKWASPQHMVKWGMLGASTVWTTHVTLVIKKFLNSTPTSTSTRVHSSSKDSSVMRVGKLLVQIADFINKTIIDSILQTSLSSNGGIIAVRRQPFLQQTFSPGLSEVMHEKFTLLFLSKIALRAHLYNSPNLQIAIPNSGDGAWLPGVGSPEERSHLSS